MLRIKGEPVAVPEPAAIVLPAKIAEAAKVQFATAGVGIVIEPAVVAVLLEAKNIDLGTEEDAEL